VSANRPLTAADTRINVVLNNDHLSFCEAVRIRRKLDDIGISIARVVVNKVANGAILDDITRHFNGYPLVR
jgi:hypothetical protein